MSMHYTVKIQALGEVRDADGNLISTEPVEAEMVVTEAELKALTEPEET